jgi:C4-dicarboxylate transporter DctM subunit
MGSLSDKLLSWCNALVGRFRGGLGHVNVVPVADLRRHVRLGRGRRGGRGQADHGHDDQGRQATRRPTPPRITAATATIGPIIPPSIPLVLYCADLRHLGGLPVRCRRGAGLVMALVMMAHELVLARTGATFRWSGRCRCAIPAAHLAGLPALMMPVVLLGGIYSGVMTPTESAAVAALYALVISVVLYRSVTRRGALHRAAGQRPADGVGGHPDRRGAGVQLRRHQGRTCRRR